tara:strand:+ start:75 stop:326 length:252 start_codon:yes stop_codon:yes gene_type:complete
MSYKAVLIASATKMATKLAEDAKEQYQEELLEYIKSDEIEEKMAEWLDEKINIPFVKDDKEKPIFRDIADVVQKVLVMVVGSK